MSIWDHVESGETVVIPSATGRVAGVRDLDDCQRRVKSPQKLECAPVGGQIGRFGLTPLLGFRRMKAITKHRSHSAAFKRQVAEEFIAGETLHALSKRHDVSRQLIRIWVGKFEAGALDEDVQAADLIQEYEAKIAALERLVGRQALELELLKGL